MKSRMDKNDFFSEEFKASIVEAGRRARIETLEAGVPVFYRDFTRDIDLMEMPDGRKFEICYIPGAPPEENYRVLRELDENAA